jgi:hypothetical protein
MWRKEGVWKAAGICLFFLLFDLVVHLVDAFLYSFEVLSLQP